MRHLAVRLQASLLALIFIAGSLGLPEADAILDHQPGTAARQGQVHLEGANGCREHADHCALGRLLTEGRDMAPAAPALAPAAAATPSLATPGAAALRSRARPSPYDSRAPPELR